jgi:hypothetical protein
MFPSKPDTYIYLIYVHDAQETDDLLYAFLAMNSHFEIAASLSMLYHLRHSDLARIFPDLGPAEFDQGLLVKGGHYPYPSSIFLRRASSPAL